MATDRSRLVTWQDPVQTAAAAGSMEGLEFVRAVMTEALPTAPIHELMQISIAAVDVGRAEFTCTPDESAYNAIGTVHGGLLCTLLDAVMGCATHTTLRRGQGFTSVEIKISYLKAVRQSSGALTAVGTVIKSGSRVAFAEGSVCDASGAMVATGSSTLLIFAPA